MDPAFAGRVIGKTMVLGMFESDSMTRQYEALFAESLTEIGVEAKSLHALIQNADKISEEELVAALQEQNYDSIIVTRKLSETERQQVVTTGYYPSHYGSYYGFYSHAYSLSSNTASVQSFREFELEPIYTTSRPGSWSGRAGRSSTTTAPISKT